MGILPALACAGLMFGCIKMMSRSHGASSPEPPGLEGRVRVLEEELARLRAERDTAIRSGA